MNDPLVAAYLKFMVHLSDIKKTELEFLPNEIINLLESHYNILNPDLRLLLVQNLWMMRTKKVAHISTIIPVFFKLFRCKDKNLWEYLLTAIVGELKLANKHAKINKVNKKLQNFVFDMIKDPDEGASKWSL